MATATLCSQMTAATEHGQELLLLQSQMGVMLHFRLRELQDGWTAKKIEFLSDGTVKFDNGAAHGTHSSVVNGIRVEFHCKADPLKMKYHSFDRIARTRLFMSSKENSEWSTFITEFSVQEPFRLPDEVEFVIVCPDLGQSRSNFDRPPSYLPRPPLLDTGAISADHPPYVPRPPGWFQKQ